MRKLVIAILFSMPLVAGGVFAQQKAGKDSVYEELNLFDQAFERIRKDAVDPVTDAKLIGAAIAGMLSGLDPHSSFLDEAAFRARARLGRAGAACRRIRTVEDLHRAALAESSTFAARAARRVRTAGRRYISGRGATRAHALSRFLRELVRTVQSRAAVG